MLNSNIIKLKVSDYPIQNGRIDKWILKLFPIKFIISDDLKLKHFFRTKIKDLILSGNIKVDGVIKKILHTKLILNINNINLPK